MKKLFLKCTVCCLVLLSMMLCISSCLSESEYIYMHDTSEISSIEIVDAYYDHKTGEAFQNTVVTIKDREEFLEDLGAIEYRVAFGAASDVATKGLAFKISYKNGEYELIRADSCSRYSNAHGYASPNAMSFDEIEFNRLMLKYLSRYITELEVKSFDLNEYREELNCHKTEENIVLGGVTDSYDVQEKAAAIWLELEYAYAVNNSLEKPFRVSYDENSNTWLVKHLGYYTSPDYYVIIDGSTGKALADWEELYYYEIIFSNGKETTIDLDNFKIEDLNDEQIIFESRSYSISSSIQYSNNSETGADAGFENNDTDRIKFSCNKIIGIKAISATLAKDCVLDLHITSELISGNAKIVIIKGEEIIEYVDFGADIHRSYQVEGEEEIYVKILAEGAELNISVERELK